MIGLISIGLRESLIIQAVETSRVMALRTVQSSIIEIMGSSSKSRQIAMRSLRPTMRSIKSLTHLPISDLVSDVRMSGHARNGDSLAEFNPPKPVKDNFL